MSSDDRSDVLLRAERLEVGFGKAAILPAVDLAVARGELWGVVGRNGAGKTTLFRTLLGFQPAVSGRVVRSEGVHLGYVPQRHALDPLVPARAKDLVAEGAERGSSFLRPFRDAATRERIERAIEATGTSQFLRRRYRDLSEGEKQRVLLARSIAGAPDLLVLDEPTSAMDVVAEREVVDVLLALRERFRLGVLLVSHHIGLVAKIADRLLFLDSDEKVAIAGSAEEVMAAPTFARRYGAVIDDVTTPRAVKPPPAATLPARKSADA